VLLDEAIKASTAFENAVLQGNMSGMSLARMRALLTRSSTRGIIICKLHTLTFWFGGATFPKVRSAPGVGAAQRTALAMTR
jgi:hypothetical protein